MNRIAHGVAGRGFLMVAAVLIIAAACGQLSAQAKPRAPRSFSAASIKLFSARNTSFVPIETDPVHFRCAGLNLGQLILYAYQTGLGRVTGGKRWIWKSRFTIEAVSSKPASNAEMRVMLRGLLVRRFGLRMQRTVKHEPVFALVAAPGGTKLQHLTPFGEPTPPRKRPGMVFGFEGQTLAQLLPFLNFAYDRGALRRPVVDRTALSGRYNIWIFLPPAKDSHGHEIPDMHALPEVLPRELGLTLKPEYGSITYYTIMSAHLPV